MTTKTGSHTEGPWGFMGTKEFGYAVHSGGLGTIADNIPNEANARLIAAAPDQNYALDRAPDPIGGLTFRNRDEAHKWMRTYADWFYGLRETAIAKAEGRSDI